MEKKGLEVSRSILNIAAEFPVVKGKHIHYPLIFINGADCFRGYDRISGCQPLRGLKPKVLNKEDQKCINRTINNESLDFAIHCVVSGLDPAFHSGT